MAQDTKWKFFYDSRQHDIKEILENAEEELIKEEITSNINDMLFSELNNDFDLPVMFFEDKGIIYGLTENIHFSNKLQNRH